MHENPYRPPEHSQAEICCTASFRPFWSQRDIRWSLGVASVLLAWDVVFTGSFVMSLFCCPIWFGGSLWRSVQYRAGWWLTLVTAGIPALTLGFVLANSAVQIKIAEANARQIILACEEFDSAKGRFPDSLDEVVPQYLASIPPAKYSLAYGKFSYVNFGRPMLVWCVIPPFNRRIYDFETEHWSVLD